MININIFFFSLITACPSNCEACEETAGYKTQCTKCKVGYFLESDGQCSSCPGNCAECNSATDCTKCSAMYFNKPSEIECKDCPANCYQCTEPKTCQICNQGFYLNSLGTCLGK